MQLLDLYVLVVRLVGVWLAFYALLHLSTFATAAAAGFLVAQALGLGVCAATAFVFLRYPRGVARWLAREDGERALTLGLGADDLQSVLLFAIGFYMIAMGIPSLVAALIPQPYQPGIAWQGVVRPAVQITVAALILTRRRWLPGLIRAVEAWRRSRAD